MDILNRIRKREWRYLLRPHVLGVLALAVLMLLWLFIFPHGLADNGDFYRVIHNLGLAHQIGSEKDDFFKYFNTTFHLTSYYIDNRVSFASSQTLFIWLSVLLNRLFVHNGTYDIRFLAVLYALVFLAASWMILELLEKCAASAFGKMPARRKMAVIYVFTAVYVFIFGDFGYLLYFNSFFGEPLFYTMFLLYAAFSSKILSEKKTGKVLLLLYTASALLFIGAKQQGAPLGIVVALFTLRLLTLQKSAKWKVGIPVLAAAVGAFSILAYTSISDEIQYINKYHAMTMGVMRYSENAQSLKAMGISPQLGMLKGTTVYDTYPVVLPDSPLMYRQMYRLLSPLKIALYYLKNPVSLQKVLDDAAASSYTIKPAMVGNYLKSSGKKPMAQSYFFSGWSWIKPHLFPHTFGFIAIFYLVMAVLLLVRYVRCVRNGFIRGRLAVEFLWAIQLMSLLEFAISFIGAGEADLAKHLFYFNVTFDILFAVALFGAVNWFYRIGGKAAH